MKKCFASKFMAALCIVMIATFAQVFPVTANGSSIGAIIDVNPDTINLKANGNFITAYIELPAPCDVGQIDIGTVLLEVNGYTIPAKTKPTKIGDYDNDGVPDLMVKFDRQIVQERMFMGPEELIVSGDVSGPLVSFQGSDTVNVISKGVSFTILQTSDLHHHASGYGPFLDYTPTPPGDMTDNDSVLGGYARLATVIKQVRAEQAEEGVPVLLLDSGDFFMGTTYDLTAGDPIALKFFQLMGYDAITLGNHEFDWAPQGLAMLLLNARNSSEGFDVPILATNTIPDGVPDTFDDGIEYFMSTGVISDKMVIDLPNGLTVGFLGQMGLDSDEKSPVASPITFDHDSAFLQSYVDDLKNDGADMVILLSHGGVENDGTGDDADLANDVDGIDIIASGHFHTATHDAIVTGDSNTIIFSPGEYGEWISRLDITYNDTLDRIVGYELTLIPIDDTIQGDPDIQEMVEQYHEGMNASLAPLGVKLDTIISATAFDLEKAPLQVTGIGSLCADSLRNVANALMPSTTPVDVGIVASGVIRDDIYQGKTGAVTFSDVYNMLPLGISPYQLSPPGYPLMHAYIYGLELYTLCEVGLSLSQMIGSDYYLNFSGIKIDYNPADALSFQGVKAVYTYAPDDPFCTGPTTFVSPYAPGLYHIVVDLYALQMLNVVTGYGFSIVPKDAGGTPVDPADYINFRIDAGGGQELKEWMAPLNFLPGLGGSIPPIIYGPGGAVEGRVNFVSP